MNHEKLMKALSDVREALDLEDDKWASVSFWTKKDEEGVMFIDGVVVDINATVS